MPKRLAIVTTHPIQYYAPVFRLLHQRGNIEIMVFYTWGKGSVAKHDPGFGQTITWDIPLTEGYPVKWERNAARDPGSHHFHGIVNPELISSIKNYEPDAVLIIGWAYHSHLKALRHFKGKVPVYFRGDSTLLDKASFARNIFRMVTLRWVYRNIDHAFYVGELNRRYFKKYGVKEAQLTFAPHAVDNSRFAEDCSAEAKRIRQQLRIGDADFMILFAGKLEPKKDPFTLLKAFRKMNRPDVHLVFAGSGVLEEELKEAVSHQRSAISGQPRAMNHEPGAMNDEPYAMNHHRIHFLPFQNQSQMPALYQACDVFCLPSKGPAETWGLAVNEAMAAGKAVIVSDKVGCAPDLVKDGEDGFIFPAGDVDALAHCLQKTLQTGLLKMMGKKSSVQLSRATFEKLVGAIEEAVCKL